MRRKSLNNYGFTLMELIVVILIIGIISAGSVVSISVVYNANSKRAAKNLAAVMSEARQQAMAGDDDDFFFTRIYGDSDGNYYADVCHSSTSADGSSYDVRATKKLGNDKIELLVGPENSTTANRRSVGSGSSTNIKEIRYVFDKDNGKLAKTITYATVGGAGTTQDTTSSKYVDMYLNGSSNYQIVVVEVTGRCYIYSGE